MKIAEASSHNKHSIFDELYVSVLEQVKDDEHRRVTSLVVEEFVGPFMAAIDAMMISGSSDISEMEL
jgi:hypothetical protein